MIRMVIEGNVEAKKTTYISKREKRDLIAHTFFERSIHNNMEYTSG
jgi:hypothetical protein